MANNGVCPIRKFDMDKHFLFIEMMNEYEKRFADFTL
jgi:hypothetical protein